MSGREENTVETKMFLQVPVGRDVGSCGVETGGADFRGPGLGLLPPEASSCGGIGFEQWGLNGASGCGGQRGVPSQNLSSPPQGSWHHPTLRAQRWR